MSRSTTNRGDNVAGNILVWAAERLACHVPREGNVAVTLTIDGTSGIVNYSILPMHTERRAVEKETPICTGTLAL